MWIYVPQHKEIKWYFLYLAAPESIVTDLHRSGVFQAMTIWLPDGLHLRRKKRQLPG